MNDNTRNAHRLAARLVHTENGYWHMLNRLHNVTGLDYWTLRAVDKDMLAAYFTCYTNGEWSVSQIIDNIAARMYLDPDWRARFRAVKGALVRKEGEARGRFLRRVFRTANVEPALVFSLLHKQGFLYASRANTIDSPEWMLCMKFGK